MQTTQLDKEQVTISLSPEEAAHLLQALEDETIRKQLGEPAEALIKLLRDHGVTPPEAPDHLRYEYAPPPR